MTEDTNVPQSNGSPNKWPLTNEWVKARLIQELALAELTQTELAKTYGVTQSAIAQFKRRHMSAIEARRTEMLDEYSALWVAEKFNRLALRQNAIEELVLNEINPRNADAIDKLLNSVASELGVFAAKNQVTVNVAAYELANVNIEDI